MFWIIMGSYNHSVWSSLNWACKVRLDHVSLQRSKVTNQGFRNECRIISPENHLSHKPDRVLEEDEGTYINLTISLDISKWDESNESDRTFSVSKITLTVEVINLGPWPLKWPYRVHEQILFKNGYILLIRFWESLFHECNTKINFYIHLCILDFYSFILWEIVGPATVHVLRPEDNVLEKVQFFYYQSFENWPEFARLAHKHLYLQI